MAKNTRDLYNPNPNDTSQDPEFYGPTGHEKRHHQTHFQMPKIKFRDTGQGDWTWVRIGPGRYKRVRKHNEVSAEAER